MNIPNRSIWSHPSKPHTAQIVDQRWLPHKVVIADLTSVEETAIAIKDMWVRGAPLIGATAGYGMFFAIKESLESDNPEEVYQLAIQRLLSTRPTAVNLHWAVERQKKVIAGAHSPEEKIDIAWKTAEAIVEEDVAISKSMGEYGLSLIEAIYQKNPDRPVNILTHCNAGRMATVEWGTATSPIYHAHQKGVPVHVWVDETRPRNQGARITAWELQHAGVPHTVIADNVGGHLMQHEMVDLCIVGTDRTTYTGDVANKIGTYLKALAAWDNGVPFYVALPSTTIDWEIRNGVKEIPIEVRGGEEVSFIQGLDLETNTIKKVRLTPEASPAENYAFDVTPAKYVTGLITEKGICEASEEGILGLFPEKK